MRFTRKYICITILLFTNCVYSQDYTYFEKYVNITEGGYSIFNNTMTDMPWTEVEKDINEGAIILLPVGVIEEHGPQICCGTDIYQAYLSAKIVKMELAEKNIPALIAPPVYWGIADIANCFPGTFTVSETTMKYLLCDIFKSLNRWGVKNIVVFNGHGESKHIEVIRRTILEANEKYDTHIYFLIEEDKKDDYRIAEFTDCIIPVEYKPAISINSRFDNVHAECMETGNMAGFFPELVDTALARTLEPTDFRAHKEFKSPRDVFAAWMKDARNVTPLGYFGDPASFDLKKSIINYINNSVSEAEAIEKFFYSK